MQRKSVRPPLRPRGSARAFELELEMSEKTIAVEISFLESQIHGTSDLALKLWMRSLLERFKEFAKNE